MNDHELLLLAAKAVGIEMAVTVYQDGSWEPGCERSFKPSSSIGGGIEFDSWNPRDDDGDSLRLAVSIPSLNLQWIIAEAWQAHEDMQGRSAYVRLAILRAAAEVGRAMP